MARQQTTRQKQARKISQAKQKKQRMKRMRRLAMIPALLLCAGLFAAGNWFLYQSGIIGRTVQNLEDGFHQQMVDSGFYIRRINIVGRDKTTQGQVLNALQVGLKDSILKPNLDDVQTVLEGLSAVRSASVERELPGSITITLHERKPSAVWQHDGVLRVIDMDGVVLEDEVAANYPHLLVMVGEDVPTKVAELVELLGDTPELAKMVTVASRVGHRRWNLKMKGGISVMLPEKEMTQAWKKLVEMQREQAILSKAIRAIDMRLNERVFIRLDDVENNPDLPHDDRQAET